MAETALRWAAAHRHGLPTPCYIYDEAAIADAFASLSSLFPGAHVLYSLKANPQLALARCLHRCGAGAEVGSEAEYAAARAAGLAPGAIVVGGVSRTREFVRAACDDGAAAFVVETRRDVGLVPDGSTVPVLVRVRPPLGDATGPDPAGWFGVEMPEAVELVAALDRRGLRWAGLHFHAGTQKLDARRVTESVDRLVAGLGALRSAGLRPGIVSFGPGIGVPYRADDRPLDEGALAPAFARLREEIGDAAQWIEAGRRLVAAAGVYVTRVVTVKRVGGRPHVFVDGGIHVHNPGIGLGRMLHANPRFAFPGAGTPAREASVQIVGSLCTSADLLGRDVAAPDLQEGDLVAVVNAGAYCATTGMWGFNSRPLFAEILLGADGTGVTLEPQHARLGAARDSVGGT